MKRGEEEERRWGGTRGRERGRERGVPTLIWGLFKSSIETSTFSELQLPSKFRGPGKYLGGCATLQLQNRHYRRGEEHDRGLVFRRVLNIVNVTEIMFDVDCLSKRN